MDTNLANKITGMEEDKVEALAEEVPSITMEHAREPADFIQGRIGGIVSALLDRGRKRSPKGP